MFSKNGTFELQLLFMKLDFLLILCNYCLSIFLCRNGSRVDVSVPNEQAVHTWRQPVYHRCQNLCWEWKPYLLPMQRLQESKELSSNWVYTIALDYQGVHAKLYDMDYTWSLVENRPLIQGPNQALVPGNIASGTRETFSPGWWLQPGLKVPAQWLLRLAFTQGTFSPGWSYQPGLKIL